VKSQSAGRSTQTAAEKTIGSRAYERTKVEDDEAQQTQQQQQLLLKEGRLLI